MQAITVMIGPLMLGGVFGRSTWGKARPSYSLAYSFVHTLEHLRLAEFFQILFHPPFFFHTTLYFLRKRAPSSGKWRREMVSKIGKGGKLFTAMPTSSLIELRVV